MGYRVAVVGATGNVGREMMNILEELEFPVDEMFAIASRKSIGVEVNFGAVKGGVLRTTREEHYLKHLDNSRKTFLRLVEKARSYPTKQADALIADRNYQDLDQLVITHLLGR